MDSDLTTLIEQQFTQFSYDLEMQSLDYWKLSLKGEFTIDLLEKNSLLTLF